MQTLVESPRVSFVSGTSLPASTPLSLYRLILPVLCILVGVSVGSATGLTLALVNASRNSVAASTDSAEMGTPPSANLAANASQAQTTESAVDPSPIAAHATANPAIEIRPVKLNSAVPSIARPAASPSKVEVALNNAPDALKPASFRLDGKEYRAARMIFLPSPNPQEQTEAQSANPTALNPAHLSLDTPPPASLYTEGVLTVSDYSPATRTIETSDGRTFVLGTTVAAGDATSWDMYRSDVRYRCDQNGSCVLMRPGVVAPDAKLI